MKVLKPEVMVNIITDPDAVFISPEQRDRAELRTCILLAIAFFLSLTVQLMPNFR